jgi:hypothetical protein
MSAASTPAPRSKSSESRSAPRHTLFLPMFILLLGMGARECYQTISMENQLDEVTQKVDLLEPKVKLTEYERTKFYMMAADVLRLAPRDANADQIAVLFGLRKLQQDKPELMNASGQTDLAALSSEASAVAATNAPPVDPFRAPATNSASTNAAPKNPATPVTK